MFPIAQLSGASARTPAHPTPPPHRNHFRDLFNTRSSRLPLRPGNAGLHRGVPVMCAGPSDGFCCHVPKYRSTQGLNLHLRQPVKAPECDVRPRRADRSTRPLPVAMSVAGPCSQRANSDITKSLKSAVRARPPRQPTTVGPSVSERKLQQRCTASTTRRAPGVPVLPPWIVDHGSNAEENKCPQPAHRTVPPANSWIDNHRLTGGDILSR